MEFTIGERMVLMNLLPKEGDITTLRIVHDLQQAISFSESDLEKLNVQQEEGQIRWSQAGADEIGTKEVEIGRAGRRLIAKALRSLDKQKKLPLGFLGIYDRFVALTEEPEDEESEEDNG